MQRISRSAAIPVLGALLWLPLVLAACTLPVSPGCSAGKSLPEDPEIFLTFVLVTEYPRGPAFAIDREGHSQMAGGFTVWMLSPYTRCRTMASEDVGQLRDAWRRAAENPGENAKNRPGHPFVAAIYRTSAGECHRFYLKPDRPGQSRELEHAAVLTAQTLQRVYGDRVLRELEITRLAGLLPTALDEDDL